MHFGGYFKWLLALPLFLFGGENVDRVTLQAEMRELRTVIQSMRAENERLRKVNEALRGEVVRLRRRAARAEPRSPLPERVPEGGGGDAPGPTEARPAPPAEKGAAILYVNPNWHYVVVERGSDQGLEVGDAGRVLRGGNPIARVEVTHAKSGQAVVDIDPSTLNAEGVYPKAGDRVVFP